MYCKKTHLLLVAAMFLSGCASQSSKAIAKLDTDSTAFTSEQCENARQNAWFHDEAQKNKLWAGPSAILLAGPVAVIPVLAANIGLSSADHIQANDITRQCGGQPLSQTELNQNIAIDAAVSVAVGGIAPTVTPKVTAP